MKTARTATMAPAAYYGRLFLYCLIAGLTALQPWLSEELFTDRLMQIKAAISVTLAVCIVWRGFIDKSATPETDAPPISVVVDTQQQEEQGAVPTREETQP